MLHGKEGINVRDACYIFAVRKLVLHLICIHTYQYTFKIARNNYILILFKFMSYDAIFSPITDDNEMKISLTAERRKFRILKNNLACKLFPWNFLLLLLVLA